MFGKVNRKKAYTGKCWVTLILKDFNATKQGRKTLLHFVYKGIETSSEPAVQPHKTHLITFPL